MVNYFVITPPKIFLKCYLMSALQRRWSFELSRLSVKLNLLKRAVLTSLWQAKNIHCQSLVVASGGLSIPTLGASGFGYDIAEQFGLQLLPRSAGLVPFTFSDWVKDISETNSGLSVDVEMSVNGISFRENLLFTHRGISGPAALQLSSYWKPGQFISVNLIARSRCSDALAGLQTV